MEPRRFLELFSGTGSVGTWAKANGYEVVSLDILPRAGATHTCNLLDWDYTIYPPTWFCALWGSPPCVAYSQARTTGPPRPLEEADRIVKKTLEIIEYFKPGLKIALLENPGTGMLRHRPIMSGIPYTMVDYCRFSSANDAFMYRKRTSIFYVIGEPKQNVLCNRKCDGVLAHPLKKMHVGTFGGVRNWGLNLKHRIPQQLVEYLFS